ncbi:MAG: hypothetical protein HZB51_24855 [Chloroflexi bacterium]|nr:hypothetical protein [Chloroflexota bacterium]
MLTFAAYLIPLFVILGIGWAAKFPRWSFPYLGAVTYVMTIVFTEPMRRLLMLGTAEAQVLTTGMMVFLIFGCLVLIGSVWRPLNSLYQGVRRDWTQFSFALYVGAVLLASAVDHDDYPTLTAMVMMPSLILLLGALAYLRSTTKLHRILSMLIPLSLAIAVRIIENKEFYPAIIAIMGGIAFLPALLEFLPREEKSPRTA